MEQDHDREDHERPRDYVSEDGHIDPLPCIVCGTRLDAAMPDTQNQPFAGTCFDTHGHYGSTIFDPMMDREYLEIVVCDDCLRFASRRGQVLLRREHRERVIRNYETWKAPEQGGSDDT